MSAPRRSSTRSRSLVNASRFRAAHEAEWERLDELVTPDARSARSRALDDDDLLALPLLYRSALSSLSVARETSLDRALVAYLEQLCTRAYFQIYGVPTSALRGSSARFFAHGWPAAVRALWRETLVCVAADRGRRGGRLSARAQRSEPGSTASFPQALAERARSVGFGARRCARRSMDSRRRTALATFATFLFTHNAQIAIFAFALGFAFAVPTVLLLAL